MPHPRLEVILHSDELDGGFWTDVPALPGCGSQGETPDEALEMTRDAIEGYVAAMLQAGEMPPAHRTGPLFVTVAA